MSRRLILPLLLTLGLGACTEALPLQNVKPFRADPTVSMSVVSISGSDVTVKISASNFKAIPAAQAQSPHVFGEGHFHIFLDIPPTAAGEAIPKTKGIFHTAESTFTIHDVTRGPHRIWVVLGYSDHTPYQNAAEDVRTGRWYGSVADARVTVTGGVVAIAPSPEASAAPSPSPVVQPSAQPSQPSGPAAATVEVASGDPSIGGAFKPASVSVHAGQTVEWTWTDTSAPHSVTSDDSKFDSGVHDAGNKYDFSFSRAGTYKYHCSVHPGMVATVNVS